MIRFSLLVATGALLLIAATALPLNAQTATSGTWTIEPSQHAGNVRLRLSFRNDSSDDSNTADVPPTGLGLTPADLASPGQHVAFTLALEAGTFACNGWMAAGKGGGSVVFTADAAYRNEMRSLGYDLSTQEQLGAAMLDVTTQYVRDLAGAGFKVPSFDTFFALRAMHVDGPYASSMRAVFPELSAEDLISLRALRVTASFVAQLRAAGVTVNSPHEAISLAALHADSAFARSLASLGYDRLSAQDLLRLRAMHIDAAFIQRVRAHGIRNPSVDDLMRLKAMDIVSP